MLSMTLILSFFFLFNCVTSGLFINYSLLSLFFKINFIIELNRIDLLNIDGWSLHFILFDLLFQVVVLATRVTSHIVVWNFTIGFKLS
jgi:hypothetical protein